ncbi:MULTISPECIES: Hsp20 family protein [Kordiimonas]|jgi:molecular chaperone IbpA|uniref:Hsp20 family protein n=1 Tax=Kordiimonas TaxID=288021 RepID=UPI00257D40CA|nr:Hsp20 family protein [Kordiimonas sp. UBA4487]
MTRFNFDPLFRTTIGFDRLARLMDAAEQQAEPSSSFPPYDIMMDGDDRYRITMSVAGFSREDIDIQAQENLLTIVGRKEQKETGGEYLHRGIAERDFKTEFQLADHVEVKGANLSDGLLTIDLVRDVPEEKRPKTIEIKSSAPAGFLDKAKKLLSDGSPKKAA